MPDTRLSPTAGTTAAVLTSNVARMLGDFPYEDIHTNNLTSSGTSVTIGTGGADRYEVGDTIDWLDDGSFNAEIVSAVADTTLTLQAPRGAHGTTAAAHDGSTTPKRFRKNPRYLSHYINKAVNDSLVQDLYPNLFAVYETQITYTPSTADWYEIDVVAEEVLFAYQKPDTGNVDLLRCLVSQPFYVDATLASTHKKAVKVRGARDDNNTIFVQYARIPAVGDLSSAMARIVEYGACKRMLEQYGAHLLSNRPELVQSGVMVPGQATRDARWFASEQDRMIRAEKTVLDRRFPRRQRKWIPGEGSTHVFERVR